MKRTKISILITLLSSLAFAADTTAKIAAETAISTQEGMATSNIKYAGEGIAAGIQRPKTYIEKIHVGYKWIIKKDVYTSYRTVTRCR